MARKNNSLRSFLLMMVVAVVLLSLASYSDATAGPRLLKQSNPAAAKATETPMVYYPQGCRCCWFIWKPVIKCGAVCCGDGCTCS